MSDNQLKLGNYVSADKVAAILRELKLSQREDVEVIDARGDNKLTGSEA